MPNSTLAPGVVLRSPKREYTISRVLGQGGFGITYLVECPFMMDNISFKGRFAVKEHFVQMLCAREESTSNIHYLPNSAEEVERSKKAFIAEAQRLQKLGIRHHNIVEVNEVFEANKTAYYVMEYIEGGSLADYVKAHGGRLSWTETAELMQPICEAVALLHANSVAHYDIKPQNIMIQQEADKLRPVLIDFGLAKHYDGQGQATSSLVAAGYTPGYASMEQYQGITTFSPATDVYALSATICFCLTGHAPAKAAELNLDEVCDELMSLEVDARIVNVLLQGLELRMSERPSDAEAFSAALFNGEPLAMVRKHQAHAQQAQQAKSGGATEAESPVVKPRRRWLWPAVGVLAVAVAATIFSLGGGDNTGSGEGDSISAANVDSLPAADSMMAAVVMPETVYVDRPTQPDKPVLAPATASQPQKQETTGSNANQQEPQTLTAKEMFQRGSTCYVNEQYTEAVSWFRKAAEQGHRVAQHNLGVCYENGIGVSQSWSESAYWFRKAAEQGYKDAQWCLGRYYQKGQGVTQSYSDAAYWFRKAAEQGHADAQNELGFCYTKGDGVTQSYSDAAYWFSKAAEQGHADAQGNLGVCYQQGLGVTKSWDDAAHWYRKAAEQGHTQSQNNIGSCYEFGYGISQSYSEAFFWYRKAAEQGYVLGQFNLGRCYENGYGVSQSKSDALIWYRKAAAQGNSKAKEAVQRLEREGYR